MFFIPLEKAESYFTFPKLKFNHVFCDICTFTVQSRSLPSSKKRK